jgi:prevent-host-death family protein
MTTRLSIYDAKTHFSKAVKEVRAGCEIIITDRGSPVAKLVPYQKKESLAEKVERLTKMGLITPKKKKKKLTKFYKSKGALKRFLNERE